MKRSIILLLLAMLPLQTAWAGIAHCPRGEHHGKHADAWGVPYGPDADHRHGDVSDAHHGHAHGDGGDVGHSGGAAFDCSPFQFVAAAPHDTAPYSLPRPDAVVIGIVLPGYNSPIPDGPDRPNWRFAA